METLFFQRNADATPRSEGTTGRRRSLIIDGFRMLLVNKRLLLWNWLGSLFCGLLGTLAFAHYVGGFLNHSLAAQQLAGRVDVAYIVELMQQSGKHGAISVVPALLSVGLFTLISVLLAAGALFVFQSGDLPRLSAVVEAGLRYFWRFVRVAITAVVVAGLTVWLLTALREAWLSRAAETHLGSELFVRSISSLAVVFLVVFLLRFYFDLVEAVVVQLGIAGDRRVRHSFPAALRLLRGNFWRAFGGYFFAGALGIALAALFTWSWAAALSPSATAMAFVLGQLAIASLLLSRLWQRALLASLTMQGTIQGRLPASSLLGSSGESSTSRGTADARTIW